MFETTSADSRDRPSAPRIETLRTPHGEVSFSPERGGIITSLKLRRGDTFQEILYLDHETFDNPEKNVKGGIPILFPNAGPIDSPLFPGMKQHGFARTVDHWESGMAKNEFWERLTTDPAIRKQFPYDFLLELRGRLDDDGSMTLTQGVTNKESGRELPVSMGLHPYFRVAADQKDKIHFDFPSGEDIADEVATWSNGGTASIDNPAVADPKSKMRIIIPEIGTLTMEASQEYKKIWVWSLPGKDFVCIEPVMRDEGGLVDDPEMVKPESTYAGTVKFRLE